MDGVQEQNALGCRTCQWRVIWESYQFKIEQAEVLTFPERVFLSLAIPLLALRGLWGTFRKRSLSSSWSPGQMLGLLSPPLTFLLSLLQASQAAETIPHPQRHQRRRAPQFCLWALQSQVTPGQGHPL